MKQYGMLYGLFCIFLFINVITGLSSCGTIVNNEKKQDIPPLKITEIPFTRGVNVTNWLQTSGPRQIQFTKFTRDDFINIKSLGCDVIRLPINLHGMTDGAPDYIVDPLFFHFLDQIIDWAEELGLHLILDNHTFDPAVKTPPDIRTPLIKVWTQMAGRYKDRSTLLYYEILNEPHGISDGKWNKIQQQVVEAIRKIDGKHTIIIGPAGWNSYHHLKYMPVYKDNNLIYTFHLYDPFIFTHQGAGWTDPSLESLAGVPFPYDPSRMPDCPSTLRNTWIYQNIRDYKNEGTVKRVQELIDIAIAFKNKHNVPLFCGEFGVFIPNSNTHDRIYWYDIVQNYFAENEIPWTIWDYTGEFGLFEKGSNELFDYDLNMDLINALGFNPVAQKEFILTPEEKGFALYTDYIDPQALESGWVDNGVIDYYSTTDPYEGDYCIYWTGGNQYNRIGFAFKPIKDLLKLVNKGYVLDFQVRGRGPALQFDIRFVDTKSGEPGDHPWRMRMVVDNTIVTWDGTWKHIRLPLDAFTEHGSWDNEWFEPVGAFDWGAVKSFEIVAEYGGFENRELWFDDLRIADGGGVQGVDVRGE